MRLDASLLVFLVQLESVVFKCNAVQKTLSAQSIRMHRSGIENPGARTILRRRTGNNKTRRGCVCWMVKESVTEVEL